MTDLSDEPTLLDADSVLWRVAGDVRVFLLLGRAFLLQVAHPTIGAGVADHSSFREDPWGRLQGSFGLVLRTIYGADGAAVGAQVRASHRGIRGVKPDGSRYSAFEPEAYWWVLATGVDGNRTLRGWSRHPLTRGEEARMYDEFREVGRRFGLRDRDMPADLAAFDRWYGEMLRERIERTPMVDAFLETLGASPPPPHVPALAWLPMRIAAGRAATVASIGTLPPAVRERLELPWSGRMQLELELLRTAARRVDLLPWRLRYLPLAQAAYGRAQRAPGAAGRTAAAA
ncbi:oxygenase MpaB family protein [Patulibacter defluvii]|uniref:oxygenase MpaB family protein n=1 Tax=Patulibacter defluvii TaxID=3095358 RepID=UPI002A7475C2|nr:oxygenase MpaB family protein [Patulibacter sp. DM4]